MPLRAQLDGIDIIVPIPDGEWDAIADKVRLKQVKLTLPCCGGAGFLRRSKYNFQHFVHHRNNGCEPESLEHLAAKFEIVKACKDLGLTALPEYCGEAWRADVLVKTPKRDACFEVQLSNQSFNETLMRQTKYEASGVRCCWLFAHLPRRLSSLSINEKESQISSAYGTPMFQLLRSRFSTTAEQPKFEVEVNGTARPLRQFVTDLLTKRLRYRRSPVRSTLQATFSIWEVKCEFCRQSFHFFHLSELSGQAQCGAEIRIVHDRSQELFPKAYAPLFDRFVQLLARPYRIFVTEEDDVKVFCCYLSHCGKMILRWQPSWKVRGLKLVSKIRIQTATALKGEFALSHWCDQPICKPETGTPFGLEEALPTLGKFEWELVKNY